MNGTIQCCSKPLGWTNVSNRYKKQRKYETLSTHVNLYLPVYLVCFFNVHNLYVAQTGIVQEHHSIPLMHNSYLCICVKNSTAPQMILQKKQARMHCGAVHDRFVVSSSGFCSFKLHMVELHHLSQHRKWLCLLVILTHYDRCNGQQDYCLQQVTTGFFLLNC